MTDDNQKEQLLLGEYCHEHGIQFLLANTKGLFG